MKTRPFIVFLLSPALLFVAYDILFYYIPISNNDYTYISGLYIFFMIFCDIVALWSFMFFSLIIKSRINNQPYHYKSISSAWFILSFLIMLYFYHFLIISVFGSINYNELFNNYARFYALSKRGTSWVFSIFNLLIFLMFYDIYKGGGNKVKIITLVSSIFLVGLTGGRSLLMVFLAFLVFIFIVIERKEVKFKWIFLSVFLVSTLFIANAVMRAGGVDEYRESSATTLDFNNAFILNDSFEYLNTHNAKLFMLEDLYYMFIPRALVPSKPLSTAETRAVYPIIANNGTNYTFGIYANSLINVGWLSYLVIPFIIIFLNYYYVLLANRITKKSISNFLIVFFVFYSIQVIRGGIFNTRIILVLIPIVLAYYVYVLLPKRWYDIK